MRIAAVAIINFFDNAIQQKIVRVSDDATWKDALLKALEKGLVDVSKDTDFTTWIDSLPDDWDEAVEELANGKMDLAVTFMNINTSKTKRA